MKQPIWTMCECVANWSCANWSECSVSYTAEDLLKTQGIVQGTQTRSCTNLNKCDVLQLEKVESRSCTKEIPVKAEETVWCGENYIEVYQKSDNQLVSRIKESAAVGINAAVLDVEFSLTNLSKSDYCWWCYNGIQDQDETGIDCGGSCAPCRNIYLGFNYFAFIKMFLIVLTLMSIIYYLIAFLPRNKENLGISRRVVPEKKVFIPQIQPKKEVALTSLPEARMNIPEKTFVISETPKEKPSQQGVRNRNLEKERLEQLKKETQKSRKEDVKKELNEAKQRRDDLRKEILSNPKEFDRINSELHELKKTINRLEKLK